MDFHIQPGGTLTGRLRVPGDKSISHRAVMLGAIAIGISEVTGFLAGEDCLCTMRAFQDMGVTIERISPTHLRVHGVGLHGLEGSPAPLDLGNSGTSMRLMSGLLAGQKFRSVLTGDASLSRRPMRRIVEPLRQMGALIHTSPGGTAPLQILPTAALSATEYASPVASAQVKSGILLAGLYAAGKTTVIEPQLSRDHTERMLRAFGVIVDSAPGRASVSGGQVLNAAAIAVPADTSSAAFFMVGAAIVPGSDILLEEVGVNPTRDGIIEILRRMGVEISLLNPRELGGEPVADLRVRGPSRLQGVEIGSDLVTLAIDEMPAVFVAAAFAEGSTLITGAEELRVKESDRIAAMCEGLGRLGGRAEARQDGARIVGCGATGRLLGGTVDSHGDHRIAMSLAMAGLRTSTAVRILDCANVDTSFPGFAAVARGAGLLIS